MSSVLLIKADEPGGDSLRQAISRKDYCVLVPNQTHAIRLMNSMTFDLLVIDIDSQSSAPEPIFQFLNQKNISVPIIAISENNEKICKQKLINENVDAIISNPGDVKQICDTITQLLESKAS